MGMSCACLVQQVKIWVGHLKQLPTLLRGKISLRVQLTSSPASLTVAVLHNEYGSFGWSSIVEPHYYTASALCEEDSEVVAIPGVALIETLAKDPKSGFVVLQQINRVIANRLSNCRSVLLKSM